MVVVSHLFFFLWKKLGKGVTRYESHPPSLKTVYFPTAPVLLIVKVVVIMTNCKELRQLEKFYRITN